jgi:hypothetical protein
MADSSGAQAGWYLSRYLMFPKPFAKEVLIAETEKRGLSGRQGEGIA